MITQFKIFENVNIPLKKYVIWRADCIEIFEMSDNIERWDDEEVILIKILYVLDKNNDIKLKDQTKSARVALSINGMEENIKNFFIYQSDHLQDCLDMLEIYAHSKKFNI